MAFIGNTNTTQAFTPAIDYFSGNGSTTAFTLSRPIASVAQVQAVVNNVAQNPSSAFTVSGNTITFTSAPSSGTNNIYVYYTSPITQVIAPGQGTVGTTQLQNGLTVNFADGTAAAPSITNDGDTNTGEFFPAADTIAWTTGGSERVRVDSSGNVGIGTTNTTDQRLKVKQSADTGASSFSFKVEANANDTGLYIGYRGAGAATAADTCAITATYGSTGAFKPMTFLTSDAERMRIDSSGNVGIGTSSPSVKLEVSGPVYSAQNNYIRIGNAYLSSGGDYCHLANNTYFNGSVWTSSANGAMYQMTGQAHNWYTQTSNAFTAVAVITSTGNFQFNSGYGSVATAYGCRAWVNFNGTGVVAIRASGNVTSITDNGTGDYTVNFTNAMPDVNYSIVGSSGSGNTYGSYAFNNPGAGSRFAVGSCRINSFITQSAGLSDVDTVCVSVFR